MSIKLVKNQSAPFVADSMIELDDKYVMLGSESITVPSTNNKMKYHFLLKQNSDLTSIDVHVDFKEDDQDSRNMYLISDDGDLMITLFNTSKLSDTTIVTELIKITELDGCNIYIQVVLDVINRCNGCSPRSVRINLFTDC